MKYDAPTAEELPLVYDAWASSYRKSPFAGCVRNCDWDTVSRGTIGEILDRPARVIVAVVDIPEGRRVVAYSVSEPAIGCLHWLYVKRNFRGQGIGRDLLAHTSAGWDRRVYTHRTNASQRFLGGAWKWDDALARVKR